MTSTERGGEATPGLDPAEYDGAKAKPGPGALDDDDGGSMGQPLVIVTGATGFLGRFVVQQLAPVARVVTMARSGADLCCDVADAGRLAQALHAAAPDHVLHLAALSRMDACSRDSDLARLTNAQPARVLGERMGRRALFVSTDLVFDGRSAPYDVTDAVAPLSAYGQSKAEGEELALAHGARVVRIPLLFGGDAQGRGATAMIRKALAEGRGLALFTNEYRTPLHALDAARGLVDLLFWSQSPDLVHLAGVERVSRWDLGRRFCALHGLDASGIAPVECQDASRPRDVSLRSAWTASRSFDEQLADA